MVRGLLTLHFMSCTLSAILVEIATTNLSQQMVIPHEERVFVTKQLREFRKCFKRYPHIIQDINQTEHCPIDFDGWGCWPPTSAGKNASIMCPSIIPGANLSGKATRFCDVRGQWSRNLDDEFIVNYNACNPNMNQKPSKELLIMVVRDLLRAYLDPYDEPEYEEPLEKCIVDVLLSPDRTEGLYCRRIYDGWGCWNDTRAGETAYTPCPTFVSYFTAPHGKFAVRICNEDGTWWKHPETNKSWANYTNCVHINDLKFRALTDYLNAGGYTISIIALTISLIIYFYFKSLKCTRVTIHKNLFIAFILSNVMWMGSMLGIPKELYPENGVECRVLHVLAHYFMVASYFWMFCEGFYLHTLLVVTFLSETRVMLWLYAIGWGFPAVIILTYALARGLDPDHSILCWSDVSSYTWIFETPVCLSLLINLIFLINIIRVLVIKLQALNTPETQQTKKAVRATIILIPLLGLHYLLLPFRPEAGTTGEYVFEIASVLVNSLQGLCIALLFCLFNSEVISLLKKTWHQIRLMRGRTKSYSSNISYSTVTRTTHESPPSDAKKKSMQNERLLHQEERGGFKVTSL